MKIHMLRKNGKLLFVVALFVSAAACTASPVKRDEPSRLPVQTVPETEEDRRVLAGEWEYEDGAAVTLKLDERGNGTYPWKEGRFETIALSDHIWQGMWYQKENDREGGFTVLFSPDFSEGEGRWWYSRIGSNHAPTDKGGTFRLSRKSTQVDISKTPSAP